jgi:hypothetical protein
VFCFKFQREFKIHLKICFENIEKKKKRVHSLLSGFGLALWPGLLPSSPSFGLTPLWPGSTPFPPARAARLAAA